MKYIQPKALAASFTCPHCGVLSKQDWRMFDWQSRSFSDSRFCPIRVSFCQHCDNKTLWIEEKMYYPDSGTAPFPNPEIPENVLKPYLEAASIQNKSPRGAAALLRLSIQILCKELGEKGKDLNLDIGNLVKKGLPVIVQQSLDIVRVTGNDAVHPGQIDTDDPETVAKLFELINIIIEYMIALPNKVSGMYSTLTPEKKEAIDNRDKSKKE